MSKSNGHKKQDFKLGDQVFIRKCEHSDVKPHTIGTIATAEFEQGFGVKVEGSFLVSGANAKRVDSVEVVFVEKKNLVNIS